MPFAIPMVWREQTNHISDSYFCMVPPLQQGFWKKKKWTLHYPNIPSAMRPVPHGKGLSIPEPPEIVKLESEKEEDYEICDISEPSTSKDHGFAHNVMSAEPHRMNETILPEIWNFRRVKQNCWHQDNNSGISSMTMCKCLHSVPAKNVWLNSLRRKVTSSPAMMLMV
jgi:hypothetical protein